MADIQKSAGAPVHNPEMADAAPAPTDPPTIFRTNYRPPDWLIPSVALDFYLGIENTRVVGSLSLKRNGDHDRPLRLDFDGNEPTEMTLDQKPVQWSVEGEQIVVENVRDGGVLGIACQIEPAKNTRLEGLYASNGMLCTQCEAEGFRRIIPFVDRPDNLSVFTVMLHGNKEQFPVLLSNGQVFAQKEKDDGTHYVCWEDPHPKPSYLFALVAGDLVRNSDSFTTASGRAVELNIYVRDGDLDRTGHAMKALKDAMAWDERVYGREYDLDLFNIVAVSDFNMGAMENKGLNIFNSRYILADPETATDADYDAIEGVVAHEYFHNWSGNRVTCRDWFQLSLKEGFTVFRDQSFSADMNDADLQRIADVRILRAAQFPEDAGPLAHPIRPDSYMEISNFYTATVYNKGAEIIRMMHSLLGAEKFRAGTDLYFDRHDGEAATCDDFVAAMEEGGDIDLTAFRRWYSTPGTPRVTVRTSHDPQTGTVTLACSQAIALNGQTPDPSELVIPLRVALFDRKSGARHSEALLTLDQSEQSFTLDAPGEPVLSFNRGFSAPVLLDSGQSPDDLAFLAAHDDDGFGRAEAMQQLTTDYLVRRISSQPTDDAAVMRGMESALTDPDLTAAFRAELLRLPTEGYLADQLVQVDPEPIFLQRQHLRRAIADRFGAQLRKLYDAAAPVGFSLSADAKGSRALRNTLLFYLVLSEDGPALALEQFDAADNMTAMQGALESLTGEMAKERATAFDRFYERFRGNALALDKWFSLQAASRRDDTLDIVRNLADHPDFTLANPNRVRSLWSSFAANPRHFHAASGEGYRMVADMILELDKSNPQTAARFVAPLGRWRRMEPKRAELMRKQLERMKAGELSKDVREQVVKSLG